MYVQPDKYVQAGGLLILWIEQDGKNASTRSVIKGRCGGSNTTPSGFPEVFPQILLLVQQHPPTKQPG